MMPDSTSSSRQFAVAATVSVLLGLIWWKLPHPVLAGAGLLPLLLVLTLRAPFLLMLGFVIFSFFRIHEVFPQLYPLRIPQLLAAGTLASLAFNWFAGYIKPFWSRELWIFATFFMLVTIGVFVATNRAEAMGSYTGTYIKIAIILIAFAWLCTTSRHFAVSAVSIVIAGLCVGVVALSNKAAGIGLVEGTRVTIGRDIGSMLGDPNDLALVLLFPASFALAMLLTKHTGKLASLLGLIGVITVFSAIIATQSRGGLLGICAVSGVFGYRKIKSKLLLGVIGAMALMVLFVLAGVSDRASGGAHEEGIDESAMGRIHAWNAAFNMALAHPVSGVGLNNFLSNYFQYSDFWDGQNHAVHSTWFGVMAETGLLGFMVFVVMIIMVVRLALLSVLQLDKHPGREHVWASVLAQATLSGLAGFMISGTFLTMGFTWPLYILMGLAVAVDRYCQRLPAPPLP